MNPLFELDLSTRLLLLWAVNVLLVVYVRYVIVPAIVGRARLTRIGPVIAMVIFHSLLFDPYRPEEFVLSLQTAVNSLWLTLWKVLALCLNRGQLVKAVESGSYAGFALGLLFPVNVAYSETPAAKKEDDKELKHAAFEDVSFSVIRFAPRQFLMEAVRLMALLLTKIILMLSMEYGTRVLANHPYWRDVCLSFFIYGLTSFLHDLFSLVVLLTLNLKLEASFNYPFLSKSVSEMWSERYNRVMNATLRDLIYYPICDGKWMANRQYLQRSEVSSIRQMIGVASTFFASAVIHIIVAMFLLHMEFPLLFSFFFLFNGVAICVEKLLKPIVDSIGLVWVLDTPFFAFLSHLYVYAVVFTLGHFFFWPDTIRCGLADKMLSGISVFGKF